MVAQEGARRRAILMKSLSKLGAELKAFDSLSFLIDYLVISGLSFYTLPPFIFLFNSCALLNCISHPALSLFMSLSSPLS